MADDAENNVTAEVAPQVDSAQSEQAAAADETAAQSPDPSQSDKDELILGKFKSQEDLIKSYQELEKEHTKIRQSHTQPEARVPEYVPPMPQQTMGNDVFDTETAQALDQWYQAKRESERAAEFERKHASELADPLLRAATLQTIREANAQGRYIDQEEALAKAKSLLDERVKPAVKEAETKGYEEGRDVAQKRQQATAVGDTNAASPKADPSKMSAREFAEYMKLPRVE